MYISAKDRETIKNKFGGKCAYSGTELLPDWQIDHIFPMIRKVSGNGALYPDNHNLDNMVPCQKLINHYKGSMPLELFRGWYLGGLHARLKKLPKNPKTDKSKRNKEYLLNIAAFFGITEDNPFSGTFYFEKQII